MQEALIHLTGERVAYQLTEYSRGNTQIYSDSEAWLFLDMLTAAPPKGHTIKLGRAVVEGEVETFGGTYLVGRIQADDRTPDGVWATKKISNPDPFSYI